ncbi:MAG: glycosyltransferase family 4 protein [Bacteroidota bacterium]|nr:glycosyltransferase family 4 protein [Bacteroidota bacterium]
MQKLLRLTTIDLSLDKLVPGQLKFMSQYYEILGVAADTGLLQEVGKREGIRVIDIPMHREISLVSDIKCLWKLYNLFRKERPYILHCNTPKGSLLGLLAGKWAGVHHRVYTVTGLRYQGSKGFFRWVLKLMETVSCYCATKVIPEGQGVLQTLQSDHITRKPLRVLHHGNINGIDIRYYSRQRVQQEGCSISGEALGLLESDFVFVFVGRIVKDKGMNELANAMQELNCKLLLVGSFDDDDPLNENCRVFLQTSPKVKCVGWQEDVRPYLAVADALVFPSYREGFPNVPIQAGAMDLPCIVTDINGCNEIIKDGINGKIINAPMNVGSVVMQNELTNTMQWFLDNPAEVKQMSSKAREMVASRFEQRDVWEATLQMYKNLQNKR